MMSIKGRRAAQWLELFFEPQRSHGDNVAIANLAKNLTREELARLLVIYGTPKKLSREVMSVFWRARDRLPYEMNINCVAYAVRDLGGSESSEIVDAAVGRCMRAYTHLQALHR